MIKPKQKSSKLMIMISISLSWENWRTEMSLCPSYLSSSPEEAFWIRQMLTFWSWWSSWDISSLVTKTLLIIIRLMQQICVRHSTISLWRGTWERLQKWIVLRYCLVLYLHACMILSIQVSTMCSLLICVMRRQSDTMIYQFLRIIISLPVLISCFRLIETGLVESTQVTLRRSDIWSSRPYCLQIWPSISQSLDILNHAVMPLISISLREKIRSRRWNSSSIWRTYQTQVKHGVYASCGQIFYSLNSLLKVTWRRSMSSLWVCSMTGIRPIWLNPNLVSLISS